MLCVFFVSAWLVAWLREVLDVSLPEWSKGLRSGRNVFERVGSNPTADIFHRTAGSVYLPKEGPLSVLPTALFAFCRESRCVGLVMRYVYM